MFIAFIQLLFISFSSQAFLIATYDKQTSIDYTKETDVIVIGYAGGLGSGFLRTAATISHKTREQFPHRQIIIYLENREKDYTSEKYVKSIGLNTVFYDGTPFTTAKLMKELLAFSQIHTLHVVSHNALENGAGLTDQTSEGRWSHLSADLEKIKMTKDGYVYLHGCNSGFLQAPEFSRRMKVPAFGSLNATNFQQPFTNDQWYFHDKILYPADVQFLTINDLSFENPVSCEKGGCYRLKPDFFPYNGYWGDFNPGGGLSFLKSFCTFTDDIAQRKARCLAAMREYMQIYPSVTTLSAKPTLEEYKLVVKDYLCGTHPKKEIRQECFKNLEMAESNPKHIFAGLAGNVLKCNNFGACDVTYKCENATHNCQLSAPKNKKPTTIVEEYLYYLEAFK